MATSANGTYEGATGGGGAGGKFRKRAFKQPPKPYARPSQPPQSAIRQSYQAAKDAFVSKLVDPAKDVIARSAHSLFASLFRKRLTAPPLVPEATRVSRGEAQQANTVVPNLGSGAQEQASNEHDKQISGTGGYGINEIEKVFKQKTFTKAEIDRLTELLQSRTVTVPEENDKNRSVRTISHMEAAHEFQEHKNLSVRGNKMGSQRISRDVPAAALNSSDVASAAELAKAYMGSVPLNVSPSNLGSRSQAFRKDVPLLTNVPYTPNTSGKSAAPSFTNGVSENGYVMPRARGRSAIYNMARTPNSRVHESATRKVDVYGASSSSQFSLENSTHSSAKQALKRRSSVFNSDMGSIGSIRRIRQKTNMMSPPKNSSLPTSGSPFPVSGNADVSAIAQCSRSVRQKQMFVNGPKDISNILLAENDNNRISNSVSVPPRSSEMAEKILQLLDKAVPSPKEKLSELKLAVAREKSPTKLTHNMLHGKALRSLEDVDSLKLLRNDTFDGLHGSQLREARDPTSHKQDKFANGDHTLIAASSSKLVPKENGFTTTASKENAPRVKISVAATSSDVHPSQKKRAFRMSAHEDFLDLDDDSDDGVVGLQTEKGKGKSAMESKAIGAETGTSENHSVPSETKSPSSFLLNEDANSKVSTVSTSAEKGGGFAFPVTAASSINTELTPTTSKAPLFSNGAAPPKEMTESPVFSFGSKSVDKVAPFKFSSKDAGANESLDSTFGAHAEPKITESSITTVATTVAETPKVSKSDENDNSQKSRDLSERPENLFSSPASTSASMNIFSSEPSSNGPKVNDGPLPFSSRFPISAAQVSNGSSDVIFSAATSTSTTIAATSTSASTTTSTPSIAATTPTFSAPSTFKFGSNSVTLPSNSSSLPSSTFGIQSTNSEQKDKTASPFGNLTGSTFGASSSSESNTSMGSSIFGFSASTMSSTPNLSSSSQSLSSNPFSTAVGSVFGTQAAPAETETETGSAPFTATLPNQFGLSASSSTFGQTASPSVSSGSSLFGSSSAASTLTGSSSGFGLSSSTSIAASSFPAISSPSIFGSSLPSSTASVFGSGFGTGTAASTTGFSFGASSAAAASAPMVFGSSLGSSPASVFSFTPAAATTTASLPQSQPVFGTPSPTLQYGSTSHSNDQMSMEDSMAEDTVQASNPVVGSVFGQPANSPPPSNFVFGSGAPSGGSPFQFGSQPNLGTPQTQSPFQPSGNLEFSAGGSFSLGTGGGDKSNRKFVKIRRDKSRKR